MRETKFLQMCSFSINSSSLLSVNLSFPLLLYVISTAILKFPLSLHRHPDSPHFSHFHLDSPNSHADSPHPHSHPIPRIPTAILSISLILFPNSPILGK